jgi:hypothetical protein
MKIGLIVLSGFGLVISLSCALVSGYCVGLLISSGEYWWAVFNGLMCLYNLFITGCLVAMLSRLITSR